MLYSWVENSDWSFIAKQAHIQMHNKQWFIAYTIDNYINQSTEFSKLEKTDLQKPTVYWKSKN